MTSQILVLTVEMMSVAVILFRVICVASRLSRKGWTGKPTQFIGLAISYPLLGGGALGALFGWQPADLLLLAGMAGLVLSDRRITYHSSSRE